MIIVGIIATFFSFAIGIVASKQLSAAEERERLLQQRLADKRLKHKLYMRKWRKKRKKEANTMKKVRKQTNKVQKQTAEPINFADEIYLIQNKAGKIEVLFKEPGKRHAGRPIASYRKREDGILRVETKITTWIE
jgi:hypothetical protein